MDEAEAFIEEHQGNGWLCFTCTGTCACQAAGSRGLTRIEAHKRRGWVGVTGGGLAPSDRQPRLSKRATRGDAAAEAEAADPAAAVEAAPAEAEEEEEEGPPGFVMVAKSAPASPALPTAPRLEVPTPARDDAPTAATPSAPPPPSAPAKRKRPAEAASAAAPAKRKRPTPAAPGAEGASIVGRRVEAWWTKYKCYFPGVLESYDEATGEYRIRYDDNEFEDVTLPDDTVRYEMATMA